MEEGAGVWREVGVVEWSGVGRKGTERRGLFAVRCTARCCGERCGIWWEVCGVLAVGVVGGWVLGRGGLRCGSGVSSMGEACRSMNKRDATTCT